MNPIWRLRILARSAGVRPCTGRSLRRYVPSVGVSSSPRIERSVDFPHPDGPAIATLDVLVDAQVANEVERLKDEPDLAVADPGALGWSETLHGAVIEEVRPFRGRVEQPKEGTYLLN